MNLSLLILLPVFTALAVLVSRSAKQVPVVALAGSLLQLALVGWVRMVYVGETLFSTVPRIALYPRNHKKNVPLLSKRNVSLFPNC
jgi:hypothetical protein